MGKAGKIPKNVCSESGCPNVVYAKEFCYKHFEIKKQTNPLLFEVKAFHAKSYHMKRRLTVIKILGNKCESCDERLITDKGRQVNLEIHHRFYDDNDIALLKRYRANSGPTQHLGYKPIGEILKMVKEGHEPLKKFGLLCKQCNLIEGWVTKNPVKAKKAFSWLKKNGLI